MRQRIRSHLTYANVISTLALFLVLGGTTYAATGGNFILGQSNTAGTPTQLSSLTTNAAGALKVTNTNTTTAGRGISAVGGAGGFGLYASGGNRSKGTAAVHGQSAAGNAVEGFSTANPASGVFGQDNGANSYGVAGHSDNGVAVVGDSSSGWAMQALGNTTQTRNANGFVKAMAFVSPLLTADPIRQCFNSQLPPGQAASENCGIGFSKTSKGQYALNFGFKVDDRLVSATTFNCFTCTLSVSTSGVGSNTMRVGTTYTPNSTPTDSDFYIILY
jgi:hypothetical protein